MTASLEAFELGKCYGKTWALQDCTFSLPAGRVSALVGPNGAGKTTLLHLATGLLEPTEGKISSLGESPTEHPGPLSRVGFLAQDAPLYPTFRVDEMLALGVHLNELWDDDFAGRRLEALDIPLDRRIAHLSGGQRAQVALVLALGKRPELLLLDEPLASLDPLARREFMQVLMETVAQEGTTIVLSSHLLTDLERVCDHLMVLTHGRMLVTDDIDSLRREHKVIVGPRRDRLPGIAEVIETRGSDRQSITIARLDGAILDPELEVHDVELEELVLAYLGFPSAPRLKDVSRLGA
jgi:ABC-2 type transport system ATP-binding protein